MGVKLRTVPFHRHVKKYGHKKYLPALVSDLKLPLKVDTARIETLPGSRHDWMGLDMPKF